jgi:hypothetical protein
MLDVTNSKNKKELKNSIKALRDRKKAKPGIVEVNHPSMQFLYRLQLKGTFKNPLKANSTIDKGILKWLFLGVNYYHGRSVSTGQLFSLLFENNKLKNTIFAAAKILEKLDLIKISFVRRTKKDFFYRYSLNYKGIYNWPYWATKEEMLKLKGEDKTKLTDKLEHITFAYFCTLKENSNEPFCKWDLLDYHVPLIFTKEQKKGKASFVKFMYAELKKVKTTDVVIRRAYAYDVLSYNGEEVERRYIEKELDNE